MDATRFGFGHAGCRGSSLHWYNYDRDNCDYSKHFYSPSPSRLRFCAQSPFRAPSGTARLPRSGQPLADCTLGMCPFAGIGRNIPRMVDGITVRQAARRTAGRRIKREADQASAGSAGFVLIAFWRDRKATPFPKLGQPQPGPRQSKSKAIKNQGNQKPRQSKTPPMGNEDGVSEGGSTRR